MTLRRTNVSRRGWLLPVALLLLILAPRLPTTDTLGCFQAPWYARSIQFIDALRVGHFDQTCLSSHPGVTTMWVVGTGLWLAEHVIGPLLPPQQLRLMALAQVLLTAVLLLALWSLLRDTLTSYGEPPAAASFGAWLACAVLALDPVYLMSTKGVTLDGPMATLAAMAVLLGLRGVRTESRRDCVGAGALFALAVLTKLPALLFFVGIGVAFFVHWRYAPAPRGFVRDVVRPLLLMGGAFALTFAACWPAMWTSPLATLELLLVTPEQSALIRRGELSELVRDADLKQGHHALLDVLLHPHAPKDTTVVYRRLRWAAFYYPAVLWFKTTPLVLAAALAGVVLAFGRRPQLPPSLRLAFHLGLFAAFYLVGMSVPAKKNWRYIVPFFAFANLAAGLVGAYLARQASARWGLARAVAVCGVPLALQLAYIASHYPHFTTYINPLAGGRRVAEEYVAFGWGEGIGEAARYIESHARRRPVRFHSGQYAQNVWLLLNDGVRVPTLDQAEFLIITERQFADRQLTQEAQHIWDTQTPEHVVRIFGVPYAWVFRVEGSHARETTSSVPPP